MRVCVCGGGILIFVSSLGDSYLSQSRKCIGLAGDTLSIRVREENKELQTMPSVAYEFLMVDVKIGTRKRCGHGGGHRACS